MDINNGVIIKLITVLPFALYSSSIKVHYNLLSPAPPCGCCFNKVPLDSSLKMSQNFRPGKGPSKMEDQETSHQS